MNYYMQPTGFAGLGAVEWGWDQYQNLAVATAMQAAGNFSVVHVGRDGSFARALPYSTRAAMLAAWDRAGGLPADVAFAIAYDRTAPADERVIEQRANPTIERLTMSRIDWKGLAPWAIGGTIVVAAAILLTRKAKATKKRAPSRKPTRTRASWRKRVVTVWR
jgi:hypothetical protein